MGHNRIFCGQCDHYTLTKRSMKHHIKTKHEGLMLKCQQCDFVVATKQGLTNHINTKHEGLIFKCHQCNFVSTTKRTLTDHINTKHNNPPPVLFSTKNKTKYLSLDVQPTKHLEHDANSTTKQQQQHTASRTRCLQEHSISITHDAYTSNIAEHLEHDVYYEKPHI